MKILTTKFLDQNSLFWGKNFAGKTISSGGWTMTAKHTRLGIHQQERDKSVLYCTHPWTSL
jgi:hypothetical protein